MTNSFFLFFFSYYIHPGGNSSYLCLTGLDLCSPQPFDVFVLFPNVSFESNTLAPSVYFIIRNYWAS